MHILEYTGILYASSSQSVGRDPTHLLVVCSFGCVQTQICANKSKCLAVVAKELQRFPRNKQRCMDVIGAMHKLPVS
ncbi:unnamed protein product [Caretta caretta]